MSWQIDQLKYTLGLSGLVSFYGIVGVGVWLLGDRFGAGNTEKIVIIAIVLLTLPFALIIGYFATRKRKKEEAQEAETQASQEVSEAQPQKLSTPSGNDDLTKSAEEAVQFLKSSNLDAYALPWYLVMGTPKSGKTSLVLGSGLNFQNLPSQRQSEQKIIRPTRSVDWRMTNDAVFIDTAGRYQTEGIDAEEWASLTETLKKYRGNRPLDGIILAVNAEKLLNSEERNIEEQAKVLRARIDEVIQRTKIKFPIYLVFTHADAIEGFRDSFSVSQKEAENLVWGATIPLEHSDTAYQLFDSEYDLLQDSTMKRRLIRLSAPFSALRQLRIFNFPLHFGSARRKLGHFVSTLFRPNPFSQSPFLRGFYFTSVPQVRSDAKDFNKTQIPNLQTVGKSYFAEKLFKDVILRDRNLTQTFISQKQSPPILGWLALIFGTFLITIFLGFSAFSLYKNKVLLDDAVERATALNTIIVADKGRDVLAKNPTETRIELDAVENLRESLAKLDDYERNSPPILLRFGFYSGNRIMRERLMSIYYNAIEPRFKQPVRKKLEADLQTFSTSSPVTNTSNLTEQEEQLLGKNYDLLKAYLMLSDVKEFKDKAEPATLSTTLEPYWKQSVPSGMDEIAKQQLDFYFKQINREKSYKDDTSDFPRVQLNNNLVDGVRKKLQAFPAVQRYYRRKITEISKEVDEKMLPTMVQTILANNNSSTDFVEGSFQVRGAYTLEGYKLMKVAISNADKELTADDWVMGEEGKKQLSQSTDVSKLNDFYMRDYANDWRDFVKNIRVKSYTRENASKALESFSRNTSPVEILMKEIAKQTNLSAKPKDGWFDWLKKLVFTEEKNETGGNTEPEKEFRPLFNFVGQDKPDESTNIFKYRNAVQSVSNKFSQSNIEQISKDYAAEPPKDPLLLLPSETTVKNLVGGFDETPSGQALIDVLQKPLGNLRILLGADAQGQLSKFWTETLLTKARDAEKGFPFDDTSEADIQKLTAYLNPVNGELTKFYKERLEKYFEDSGGKLRVKADSPVKFSDDFVNYLNNAFRLQTALYGKNATPNFEYEFSLNQVKDAIIEVKIDGTSLNSEGTRSAKFTFPARTGTDTGAFMSFASTAETSSTSGKPIATPTPTPIANLDANSSANSANSNVNTVVNKPAVTKTPQVSNNQPNSAKLTFAGNWGLFRFVDAGLPKKNANGGYDLSYKLGSKTVTASIKASGGDLFDRNMFRSVKAPEKFLK